MLTLLRRQPTALEASRAAAQRAGLYATPATVDWFDCTVRAADLPSGTVVHTTGRTLRVSREFGEPLLVA